MVCVKNDLLAHDYTCAQHAVEITNNVLAKITTNIEHDSTRIKQGDWSQVSRHLIEQEINMLDGISVSAVMSRRC